MNWIIYIYLYADARKGWRPEVACASPEAAQALVAALAEALPDLRVMAQRRWRTVGQMELS